MPRLLGDITASDVDTDDQHRIAAVTALTVQTVRRRLRDVHGNTLVRNVFQRDWPSDVATLEACTVALARDAGLVTEIARHTGLSTRTVAKRLNTARGNMLVGTAFPELDLVNAHEDGREDDVSGDEDQWTDLVDAPELELLDSSYVVSVRGAPTVSWLANFFGWSTGAMQTLLLDTHGRTRLRNVIEVWPRSVPVDAPIMLGELRVSDARRSDSLIVWIARIMNLAPANIAEQMREADGAVAVSTLFAPWVSRSSHVADPGPEPRAPRKPRCRGHDEVPIHGPCRSIVPGVVITGRWLVIRAIENRGTFGVIFEVKDQSRPDRDTFVMKVADGGTAAERLASEERLRSEISVAHPLTHQNICAYLDDGRDPDLNVYFAIMKPAGESLERLLADDAPIALPDAIEILQQVASGLDYAHRRGVIHQNLQPAHIFVQSLPEGREARIADWGFSRHSHTASPANVTTTNAATTLVGQSRGFIAPEQWRGEARAASDQYCLALVLCSMLESRVFTDHYKFAASKALTTSQNAVVARALSYEPEDRFQSCGQFVARLLEG